MVRHAVPCVCKEWNETLPLAGCEPSARDARGRLSKRGRESGGEEGPLPPHRMQPRSGSGPFATLSAPRGTSHVSAKTQRRLVRPPFRPGLCRRAGFARGPRPHTELESRGKPKRIISHCSFHTASAPPPPTSLSALGEEEEETTLDIDLLTAAKKPSLCGLGSDSGAGASGRRTAGCATKTRGLLPSPSEAPLHAAAPAEPNADAGATGAEEEQEPAAAPLASPPLLLLLLLPLELPAPPSPFALVAWNFGSL